MIHRHSPSARNGIPTLIMAIFCWLVFVTWAVVEAVNPSEDEARSSGGLGDSSLPLAVSLYLESPETAIELWGPISDWDTQHVTTLDRLFEGAINFDEDLSHWNTDKVTSMEYTFAGAAHFNQPLNTWNVAKVSSLFGTFNGASTFNQNLNKWDTSKVTDMGSTFKGAYEFDGSLNGWNTTSVRNMERMFYGASFFTDQRNSLKKWDVTSVTTMHSMFSGATAFAGDITTWKPWSVTSFMGMFAYTASFDQDLSGWDVSSAIFMDRMFYRAVAFESELCWDDSISDGVSGSEIFCGSSGEFTLECVVIPSGSEDYCPETYDEFEEDEELRDGLTQQREQETQSQEAAIPVGDGNSPGYGGSGGIGALNPGGMGRDHPEYTANLNGWQNSPTTTTTEEQEGEEVVPAAAEDNPGGAPLD
ncbi:Mycoplasma protein of unknown function, DUF285 (Partial), partial [Seminavis robusta]|eukprot:Sro1914_g305030.1 Mycoplasma protein of unknown function, DUF285 (417) ;mRNA; r:2-1390